MTNLDDIGLTDQLTATPGIRYMAYDGESGPAGELENIPDITMDGWAPSLKLTYQWDTANLGYLSVARALRMPTPPEHYWHYDAEYEERYGYPAAETTAGICMKTRF